VKVDLIGFKSQPFADAQGGVVDGQLADSGFSADDGSDDVDQLCERAGSPKRGQALGESTGGFL
jgi:hypothetical protein